MKKILVFVLCIMLLLSLAGCMDASSVTPPVDNRSSYEKSMEANEQSAKAAMANDTLPVVTRSLERENIKRRIEFINQPDNVGYLYLMTDSGQVMREVQVLGKVSSLNSYLTPMEDIQWFEKDLGESWGEIPVVTSAPDLDGTYGENAQGIFWFDMDGAYQEWNGLYHYSAVRLTMTTQPVLLEAVQ